MPSDDEIRSLLRSARVETPMPADVASRLDDVLAGLGAEDAQGELPQQVRQIPLSRRWAPRLLAAAAAVVLVGGVGIGLQQVVGGGSADEVASLDGGGEAAGSSADEDRRERAEQEPAAPELAEDRTYSAKPRTRLSQQSLRADLLSAARDLRVAPEDTVTGPTPAPTPTPGDVTANGDTGDVVDPTSCPTPLLATDEEARTELVSLDGMLALLVLGPARAGGIHDVELWSCADDGLVVRRELDLD